MAEPQGTHGPVVPFATQARILTPLPRDRIAHIRRNAFSDVRWLTVLYATQLVVALYVLERMFSTAGPVLFKVGLSIRYLLWLTIVIGTCAHIVRRGLVDLIEPFAIFLPFFAIGVISGLISLQPLDGARELAFWLLSVAAASAVGRQLGERLTMQLLFWVMSAAMLASIALVLARPEMAVDMDLRSASGAWRGVFEGKNWMGFYADFGLLIALIVPGIAWPFRLASVGAIGLCLVRAHSSGATVEAALMLSFVGLLAVTRRLRISPGMQALAVGSILILIIVAGLLLSDPILHLLNRDATLSGRTAIWAAYGRRALDYWFLGAGPGSFSHLTRATADIGLSLQGLGLIQTPHNMYIAVFGEVGVFGFVALIAAIAYLTFVLPFRIRGRASLLISGFCFLVLASGAEETHQVFGIGIGDYLIVLLAAALGHAEGGEPLRAALADSVASNGPTPAAPAAQPGQKPPPVLRQPNVLG